MDKELTHNLKKVLAYEKNTRISVPSYDALFTMIQSYFRSQLSEKEASLLVIGAGGVHFRSNIAVWGKGPCR